jgi:hypothetical protein
MADCSRMIDGERERLPDVPKVSGLRDRVPDLPKVSDLCDRFLANAQLLSDLCEHTRVTSSTIG